MRIDVDDTFDGPAADFAEANFVAREHDAIGLRAEESFRFVARAFERADLAGVLFVDVEKLRFPLLLFAEERVHLATPDDSPRATFGAAPGSRANVFRIPLCSTASATARRHRRDRPTSDARHRQ